MRALVVLFLALLGAAPGASAAADEKPNTLGGWAADPDLNLAATLLHDYNIAVVNDPDAPWKDGELVALSRGAAAMPDALRNTVREPIVMRRVHHPCLFGVGRMTKGCPTYSDDGEFLIYDLPPVQGEGPVHRFAPLRADERVELQRRRAAVHAYMRALDEQHRWSEQPQWRRINGWRTKRAALNRDAWGYSRYLGMHSPSLDLVTFAEEWFVRPADVVPPEQWDRLDPDRSVDCEDFTRSRFLAERVFAVDAAWHPPPRSKAAPHQKCPAFEAWARTAEVEGIDVLVASATGDRPESLYGHLLVHVRYLGRSDGFEPVYQFGAVTDTNVNPITYFSRGLLGGFTSVLEMSSYRQIDRLFLQYEQRDLRRYELRLSPVQTRHLLQRIWEYERRFRYPYHFFANNCASFLIDLIGPALALDVPDRSHFIVSPTDVLDFLAAVENGPRGALLVKRPEVSFSGREVAQHAVKQRRLVLEGVIDAAGPAADRSEVLRSLDRQLDRSDPLERLAAYPRLERELATILAASRGDGLRRRVIDYLYLSSQIERYFAEVMHFRGRAIKVAALTDPPRFSAEELLERRRQLYATNDLNERQTLLMSWSEQLEERAQNGPFRDLKPSEQREMELKEHTDRAYRAALDALASTIERFEPEFDGVAFLDDKHEALLSEQARRDELSTGPSGKGRISIGGAATSDLTFTPGAAVDAQYSFIWERLGEQRRRGFRSDIESRALGLELRVPVADRFWEQVDLDLTVFRFMTIEQRLGPIRKSLLDTLGWGFDGSLGHDGRRGLNLEIAAAGGWLFPIWTRDRAAHHLVAGTWLDTRVDFGRQGRRILGGGSAFLRLQLHLYGVYANVLRAEVGTFQAFGLEDLSYRHQQHGVLSTEHVLFWAGQYPVLFSPAIRAEWTNIDYLDRSGDFIDLRAGATVELPL